MILSRVLGDEVNDDFNLHALVLVNKLSAFSLPPLLRACFGMRPVTIFYFQASAFGLKLATFLKVLGFVSGEPRQIKDFYLSDTPHNVGTEVRFEALKLCMNTQSSVSKLVERILPEFDSYFRDVCATGVRKEFQYRLSEFFIQLNMAKVLARDAGISTHKVVMISPAAFLLNILRVDPRFSSGVKAYQQPFDNKVQLYLWWPVISSLGQMMMSLAMSLLPPKKDMPIAEKRKPLVGVPAVWGFKGLDKNRDKGPIDDFFWWRQSTLSPEQIIYMFERQDFQPTRDRLAALEKLRIKSIALDPRFPGDITECRIGRVLSLVDSLRRIFFLFQIGFPRLVRRWIYPFNIFISGVANL